MVFCNAWVALVSLYVYNLYNCKEKYVFNSCYIYIYICACVCVSSELVQDVVHQPYDLQERKAMKKNMNGETKKERKKERNKERKQASKKDRKKDRKTGKTGRRKGRDTSVRTRCFNCDQC